MGSGVHSLGYFLFEVSDLDAWDHFLTKVLGVERGEALGEGLVPYRTDERAARISAPAGAGRRLDRARLRGAQRADLLHEVTTHVREAGRSADPAFPPTEASGARRRVASFGPSSPGGVAVELFYGPVHGRPLRSPARTVARRVRHRRAGRRSSRAPRRQHRRDAIVLRAGPEPSVSATTSAARCRATSRSTSHSCTSIRATTPWRSAPAFPKHLHHFMLQMGSLDDVGAALDRAFAHRRARRAGPRPPPERPDGDVLLRHPLGLRMRSRLGRTHRGRLYVGANHVQPS